MIVKVQTVGPQYSLPSLRMQTYLCNILRRQREWYLVPTVSEKDKPIRACISLLQPAPVLNEQASTLEVFQRHFLPLWIMFIFLDASSYKAYLKGTYSGSSFLKCSHLYSIYSMNQGMSYLVWSTIRKKKSCVNMFEFPTYSYSTTYKVC
jgi:hypothetical protein